MASGNDYFMPEQIDEQIEHLHHTTSLEEPADEAELVNALHRYYRAPAADEVVLERARQRILGDHSTGDIPGSGDKPVTPLSASQLVPHPRSARLVRIVSGLAAVILVGTLIGGWLAVTHLVGGSRPYTPPPVLRSTTSDLYAVQNGVAYRLAGSSGKVIWQDRLETSRRSGTANLQVVDGVVYVVLDFDIYALEVGNGHQIWHVANPAKKAYFWFEVANGHVYLYSLDNTFSALSTANGSPLWQNTTFTTEDGYDSSVLNGNLYTVNNDATQLYSLDGTTGQVRWHDYLAPFSIFGPPQIADGIVYAAAGNFVYALNEQSGEKIWKQTVPATSSFATAYLARGVLYVTNVSSDAVAGPQTEVRSFFAYSAQTGQLLWASGSGYGQFFNAPITNGLLFAPREYNGVYSIAGLDAETGQVAWQAPFKCGVSHFDRQVVPTCNTIWTAIINGELYLLASDAPQEGKASVTIKSFNPETGQNLSATALTLQQNSSNLLALAQNSVAVVGASNGLLYIRVGVAKTANDLPYADFIFAAYRLSDGSLAWSHAMPHFPPPTSANTTPNTSQPVLAP